MTFVVDTSALVRLFIPDGPVPEALEAALAGAEQGNDVLIAPESLLAEAGQVLLKKQRVGTLSQEELNEIADGVEGLPIRLFSHHGSLRPACALAGELGLTVYDALFLHLAQSQGAQLVTADAALSSAARRLGL